jgi:hypothetical protein
MIYLLRLTNLFIYLFLEMNLKESIELLVEECKIILKFLWHYEWSIVKQKSQDWNGSLKSILMY